MPFRAAQPFQCLLSLLEEQTGELAIGASKNYSDQMNCLDCYTRILRIIFKHPLEPASNKRGAFLRLRKSDHVIKRRTCLSCS